jgi:branched-chain amino acid transport system permease protein
MARLQQWVLPLTFAAMCFVPLLTDGYTQYIVNLVLAYVVVAIGLNLLLGYAGQFAFSNAAFMGLGAYTTALATADLGLSYFIALPLSGVLAAVLGGIVALPSFRLKTVYLAMISMAFAELVQWIFIHWKRVTHGTDGVSVPWPQLGGEAIRGDQNIYYIILATTFAAYFLARQILQSKLGRAFTAIRENEIVARCNGINVTAVKATLFCISAFYAGIGGSLFALALRFVVPDGFSLLQLVLHFSIVLIGGLGSLVGAVIGAAVLTALPELLRGLQGLQELIYGVVLLVFVIFMPKGIAGLLLRQGWLPREILVRGWREAAKK